MEICPEDAICFLNGVYTVDDKKCIGCQKCQCDAISYSTSAAEKDWKNFKDIVEKYPVAMVELHISTTNTKQIFEKWKTVLENFKGYYSICVSRNSFSDAELKTLLDKMISMTDKERVFIQADGVPMSGCVNSYKATLQAVACAELLSGLGVKLIISGGANEKTAQLAKMCEVDYCGIALGSYARKIIKNSSYSEALKSAKKLVNVVKNG